MRDITKRFAIVYNGWPVESFDELGLAKVRMAELVENQERSLEDTYPNQTWDVKKLWMVTDVLGPVEMPRKRGAWASVVGWFRATPG
jgi:hypothetical protein